MFYLYSSEATPQVLIPKLFNVTWYGHQISKLELDIFTQIFHTYFLLRTIG